MFPPSCPPALPAISWTNPCRSTLAAPREEEDTLGIIRASLRSRPKVSTATSTRLCPCLPTGLSVPILCSEDARGWAGLSLPSLTMSVHLSPSWLVGRGREAKVSGLCLRRLQHHQHGLHRVEQSVLLPAGGGGDHRGEGTASPAEAGAGGSGTALRAGEGWAGQELQMSAALGLHPCRCSKATWVARLEPGLGPSNVCRSLSQPVAL